MMSAKRFRATEYGSDYYIEIIDNEKELDKSIHNPSQKLGLLECVDLLNELAEENEQLRTQLLLCQQSKDGRFQVWEEPPIPKGKRISFTINNGNGDGV